MICAGIDLSLTSPAICVNLNEEEFSFDTCQLDYLTDVEKRIVSTDNINGSIFPPYGNQYERYENISRWIVNILQYYDVKKVFLEDYSFGSTGRVFHIAENTGVLKYLLWRNNIDFVTIPPTVIKKIATGKGNANKELMEQAFINETNVNLKNILNLSPKQWNPSSDLIDSFYICKLGFYDYLKENSIG